MGTPNNQIRISNPFVIIVLLMRGVSHSYFLNGNGQVFMVGGVG